MNYDLSGSPDELRDSFYLLTEPADVAEMLEVKYQDFNYWMYRTPELRRYRTFAIPKKGGGSRRIDAPRTNVKILQQKLNQILQVVYLPKPSVHGFTLDRSVKTNAETHLGKRWVLNVDIEDFFPSINFGRVRGMFMGKPYYVPERAATVLAHLCCYQRRLPQGAPTSPVVSNMICAQLDSQLQELARVSRCTYTRYADDMTFSTTSRTFPSSLCSLNRIGQLQLGDRLRDTIEQNGFKINSRKVWLYGQHQRQEVTGVTVNEFPNLPRRFTNQIRAMLYAWKKFGLPAAQERWEAKWDTKPRAPWGKPPRFEKVLKGKIEYLGMIKGMESRAYLEFLDQLGELAPDLTDGRGTPLRLLLGDYDSLSDGSESPQQRGIALEKLMNSLFKTFEIPCQESFRRNSGGEQIDGAFELDGWYYLVECKWQKKVSDQQEIDGLRGKLDRSGAQTMGVFLSINGWSGNVENLTKQNSGKRVILIDGNDLRSVLAGDLGLPDMIKEKLRFLNLRAEPFVSVEAILSERGARDQ